MKKRISTIVSSHLVGRKRRERKNKEKKGGTNAMSGLMFLLYGPAGTGKTTTAKKVAEALGKKFARISMGG